MCANTVTKALKGVDGVQDVQVEVAGKKARVRYAKERTNLQALETAVAGAGYQANGTQADSAAYAKLPACCKLPASR